MTFVSGYFGRHIVDFVFSLHGVGVLTASRWIRNPGPADWYLWYTRGHLVGTFALGLGKRAWLPENVGERRRPSSMALDSRFRLIQGYYLGTPLFFLADVFWGWRVRLADGVGDWTFRCIYYGFCFLCAFLCMKWPRLAPLVGVGESSVNVLLLVLGVLLPVIQAPGRVLRGEPVVGLFTLAAFVNFCLTGGMLAVSFHRNLMALERMGQGREEGRRSFRSKNL